ncbi:MAG: hypothetical protein H0V43_14205 [Gemmatimonadales bacterium]|nr:hypothetical protein [Gemmatimonadales bacterium]
MARESRDSERVVDIGLAKEKCMEDPLAEKIFDVIHRKDQRNGELALLISTGSFAPVHIMHVRMMESARKFATQQLGYDVVAGILSPSAEAYVEKKLTKHDCKSTLISNVHRLAMLQLAVQDTPWPLFVSDWECSQSTVVSFPSVGKAPPFVLIALPSCHKL